MRQELSETELTAIKHVWDSDISVGGAPKGWTLESLTRKVEDQTFNGMSFKAAMMRILSRVPRPGEDTKESRRDILKAKVAALKKNRKGQFVQSLKHRYHFGVD